MTPEETDELRISPQLLDRVVRGSQRRRRRARAMAAAAIALVVAAGAVPAYLVATRGQEIVAENVRAEIDGVEIRYLPEGLAGPTRAEVTLADLYGTALSWADGDRWVVISVYRTGRRPMEDAMDILALNAVPSPVEPRKANGPVVSRDGTDRLWVPRPGVLLRVMTSPSLKNHLDRIAGGLRVRWTADIGNVRVTYMPDGWRSSGETVMGNDGLAQSWSPDEADGVTVEVVYGLRAMDLKSLPRCGRGGTLSLGRRTSPPRTSSGPSSGECPALCSRGARPGASTGSRDCCTAAGSSGRRSPAWPSRSRLWSIPTARRRSRRWRWRPSSAAFSENLGRQGTFHPARGSDLKRFKDDESAG